MSLGRFEYESANQITSPNRDRLPSLLDKIAGTDGYKELEALPGIRSVEVPTRNSIVEYGLQIHEDTTFVTLHAEIARVEATPPPTFDQHIVEINRFTPQAALIREPDIKGSESGPSDSVYLTKQIRKYGVPTSTLIEEIASFDAGVEFAYPQIQQAIEATGARSLPSPVQAVPPAVTSLPKQVSDLIEDYYSRFGDD